MSSRPFLETCAAAGRELRALTGHGCSVPCQNRLVCDDVSPQTLGRTRGLCGVTRGLLGHPRPPALRQSLASTLVLRMLLQTGSHPRSQGRMLSALGRLRGSPRPRGHGL